MIYIARSPLFRVLRIALFPLMLLSLLAVNLSLIDNSEQEHSQYEIEHYEHKIIQPIRTHTAHSKVLPPQRLNYSGITPPHAPVTSATVLAVSLYPIIYLIKKRLLLYPLKYTSHYVGR
ncbi:hypothetical protein [Paenibacillus jilunlii]|uniref:Uncharacterized protein n=1 Tax=Paenibacillus jilunlii TaxID=682956 RepID=A0A1G9GZD8_9BACL|nr:hypothetical protein [Paenibacillus jilunlii]KWX73975.1 hypothetical protein AML91_17165 [Paenibacillus jilunlii]SDL06027.1 hypothetical protein SAMN05216191_101636 [Paenibacillus jilunlii]